jgi:hypothetical protein
MPRALDWLKKHRNGKFFLFLHGYDVHGQSEPKDGFDYRFVKNPYNGKYTGSKKEQGALREEGLKENSLALSEEDIAFWRAIYDEKINRMDEKFGNFMEEMQAMGLMENTIFIVFSDHGTEFMEHKKFDHGHSLYSELVDVFFAVYIPGQDGKIINELVSTLDIFPTLMGLLEKEPASIKQIKGVDLSAAIMGKGAVPQRNVFSETDYRLYTHKRSVQTPDGWKMILTMNDAGNEKELYNLKSDPDEKINLISAEARIGYELEQAIYIHLNKMKANGPWILGCLPVYGDQCQ